MKKQFCTYDIALALKELGFNKKCLMWFDTNGDLTPYLGSSPEINELYVKAPLWQQAIDFFREKHRLDVTVKFPEPKDGRVHYGANHAYYDIEIKSLFGGDVWNKYKFSQYSDDYYKARKKAIECAINEVKHIMSEAKPDFANAIPNTYLRICADFDNDCKDVMDHKECFLGNKSGFGLASGYCPFLFVFDTKKEKI